MLSHPSSPIIVLYRPHEQNGTPQTPVSVLVPTPIPTVLTVYLFLLGGVALRSAIVAVDRRVLELCRCYRVDAPPL